MEKVHPEPIFELESENNHKLRRLPLVFDKFIELSLPMDTNVHTYFSVYAYYFIVPPAAIGEPGEVKVHVVTIDRWDITKVVVHLGPGEPNLRDDMVYDKLRFRLPKSCIPSMITAKYVDGHLVVTVPNAVVGNDDKGTLLHLNGGQQGGEKKGEMCGDASSVPAT